MLWTVIAAIFLLGGAVTTLIIPRTIGKHPDNPRPNNYGDYPVNGRVLTRVIGGVAIGFGALIFVIAGISPVPVKNVGVVTSFGHVEGDMLPGFHWILPWKGVTNLPETVQTTTWQGGFDKAGTSCVGALDVRIGGQQHACLDATIQWQVKDSAAPKLFNLYNTGGSVLSDITNAVVIREFEVAANQILGDYNPIQDVSLNSGAGNSQFSTFTPKLKALMIRDIGNEITIRTVLLKFLHYDASTQARLNTIQQQYAATAIALQQVKTNTALSKANKALSSVTGPELIAQCLSIAKEEGVAPGGCITGAAASIAIGK